MAPGTVRRQSFLRASDADREVVAEVLRENTGDGRLSLDEFDHRVARAYAATTLDDLHRLVDDLPVSLEDRLPVQTGTPAAGPAAARPARRRWPVGPVGAQWAPWLTTAAICMAIWLVSSVAANQVLYFWPFWVIGPWGFVLLRRSVGRSGGYRHHRRSW